MSFSVYKIHQQNRNLPLFFKFSKTDFTLATRIVNTKMHRISIVLKNKTVTRSIFRTFSQRPFTREANPSNVETVVFTDCPITGIPCLFFNYPFFGIIKNLQRFSSIKIILNCFTKQSVIPVIHKINQAALSSRKFGTQIHLKGNYSSIIIFFII